MSSRGGIYTGPGGTQLYGDGREVNPTKSDRNSTMRIETTFARLQKHDQFYFPGQEDSHLICAKADDRSFRRPNKDPEQIANVDTLVLLAYPRVPRIVLPRTVQGLDMVHVLMPNGVVLYLQIADDALLVSAGSQGRLNIAQARDSNGVEIKVIT